MTDLHGFLIIDPYRGVIVRHAGPVPGQPRERERKHRMNCKDKVLLMASKKVDAYELDEIGSTRSWRPISAKVDELHAGEVGYLAASIKA